jgi:hypothetical protein
MFQLGIRHTRSLEFLEDALGGQAGGKQHDGQACAWVGGCACEVQVFVFRMAVLRAQETDLPEVVAQAEGRTFARLKRSCQVLGV